MDPDYYKEKLQCDLKTINASKVLIRSKKTTMVDIYVLFNEILSTAVLFKLNSSSFQPEIFALKNDIEQKS